MEDIIKVIFQTMFDSELDREILGKPEKREGKMSFKTKNVHMFSIASEGNFYLKVHIKK